jgi:cytoskeletal protein RodZ
MSDSNELKTAPPAGMPVPDLIEHYRVRRDAWIAQADELARLRDEVRGSAEREAMEIVTAARRDVRQIVMEARRELLVLSAQVQAALGEAGVRPDGRALLDLAQDDDGETGPSAFAGNIFSPDAAVKGMLEDTRADMDALVEDARTVPFQALAEPTPMLPEPEPPSAFSSASTLASLQPLPSSPPSDDEVSPAASRMMLPSPFPSDAVPVPTNGRARLLVGLFGAAGILVLVGTIWWLRSGDAAVTPAETAAAQPAPATAASEPAPVAPTAATTPTPAAPTEKAASSSALTLVVEARRSSWLRTTVDGQSDDGRMLAQGETVKLNARQGILLRVGDAGAVFVSVNNGQAAALGSDGQVVTRQFVVESADRKTAPAPPLPGAPQPSEPPLPQKSTPLSAPIATTTPIVQAPAPTPLPIVQPVAATPNPAPEPVAPPGPRTEIAPPVTARPEPPIPGQTPSASAVITASRQWLDAYHRQDRAAMALLSMEGLQLADERRNEERFPANVDVNRTLDRVSVQIAADTAVLTAIMTERSSDNGVPARVSPISQVWELRGNQWRVRQVRLVSEARLNQIFR